MKAALTGEALIDFVATGELVYKGYPGGSPFNTAIAAARLGVPTGFLSQLSDDLFGRRLRRHLEDNGVDVRFVLTSSAPSTLAFVERDAEVNRYVFLAQGSADRGYAPDPLPSLPAETAYLSFGSVALLGEPAATTITRLVEAHRNRTIVVLDPNVRPSLVEDAAAYRARMTRWIGLADIVKISREDIEYLADTSEADDAARSWLALGPKIVVVTAGAHGARLYRGGEPLDVPGFDVDVVDTIGAGDTFTAGLIAGLLRAGVARAEQLAPTSGETLRQVLRFASAAAGLACTRPGADPPSLESVERFLSVVDGGVRADPRRKLNAPR
jgi:fructokinase